MNVRAHMLHSRALTILFAASIGGCTTDPSTEETARQWPCGSIQTGGHDGLANIHARYQYDDLHNVVWSEETNYEKGGEYGMVVATETKTFEGRIAVSEERVASGWHEKTARDLLGGRITRETITNFTYNPTSPDIAVGTWTYDGDRVARIDFQDITRNRPSTYSVFTYPGSDTLVDRHCAFDHDRGTEYCSSTTYVGGLETWTNKRRDSDEDGTAEHEVVRTLDTNGLPLTIESYNVRSGIRRLDKRTTIERRPDGAPLFMDDGFTQTEYLFACD